MSAVAANRWLTPVYQPLYDLKTGAVAGYEGLVRPGEQAGFENASALFVAAEAAGRTGRARPREPRVRPRRRAGPRRFRVPVGQPVAPFARGAGVQRVRRAVDRAPLRDRRHPARRRAHRARGGGGPRQAAAALAALRRHGVRTAADDVGAGNAGLRLLSEVRFDIMKIDLTLVRAGAASDSADAVLRALRGLARRQRQTIVAEGVETLEELALVMDLGFDIVQGYLLQRPAQHLAAKDLDFDAFREARDIDPRAEAGAA